MSSDLRSSEGTTESENLGTGEGDTCGRDGCKGIIQTLPPENCSCHIAPPCGACMSNDRIECPECHWNLGLDG